MRIAERFRWLRFVRLYARVPDAEMMPPGCGIVHRDIARRQSVCALMPFNLVLRVLWLGYMWVLQARFGRRWDGRWSQMAYREGFRCGYREGERDTARGKDAK